MNKLLLFLFPLFLLAKTNNSFFQSGNIGWFFNEYSENNETNKTKISKLQRNPYDYNKLMKLPDNEFIKQVPINELNNFRADEFKKVFQRIRNIAVMNPTQRNVYLVKKYQKFMTEQAEKFAKVWYLQSIEKPNELGYPQIASTSFGRTPAYYKQKKEYDEFFKKHSKDIGFVVFYDPKDKMVNAREKWVYKYLKEEYPDYTVMWINIIQRPDLVKKFGIKALPDNFYIYKNKKGEAIWVRIKAGLVTEAELKDNVIFTFKNIILKKDK